MKAAHLKDYSKSIYDGEYLYLTIRFEDYLMILFLKLHLSTLSTPYYLSWI